ncbi:MAG: hypothetical protein WCW13_03560 [archaeon]|jgi:hypothetical protein
MGPIRKLPILVRRTLETHRSNLANANRLNVEVTSHSTTKTELNAVERALKTGRLGTVEKMEIRRIRGNIEDDIARCRDQLLRNNRIREKSPSILAETKALQLRIKRGERDSKILSRFL